jgi:hypothetical protein
MRRPVISQTKSDRPAKHLVLVREPRLVRGKVRLKTARIFSPCGRSERIETNRKNPHVVAILDAHFEWMNRQSERVEPMYGHNLGTAIHPLAMQAWAPRRLIACEAFKSTNLGGRSAKS